MYGCDKSGLSDPYAKVSFNRYSSTTRVVKESLCPTWDQTIVISQIRMYEEPETTRDSLPPVILKFYDKDMMVGIVETVLVLTELFSTVRGGSSNFSLVRQCWVPIKTKKVIIPHQI